MRKKRVYQPIPEQNCGNCLYFKEHYVRGKYCFLIDDNNGVCGFGNSISDGLTYSHKGADCDKWKAQQKTDATLDEIKEAVMVAAEMLRTLSKKINTIIDTKK